MNERLSFRASMPIMALDRIYRERYKGSEASIMFQPTMENMLHFQIDMTAPHMVARDPEALKRFENAARRALHELVRECETIAWESEEARKETI